MTAHIERAGLAVVWQEDHSVAHRETANALAHAFAAHRLWAQWLGEGRVRKLALVAVRPR